jgi:hypothetical protein
MCQVPSCVLPHRLNTRVADPGLLRTCGRSEMTRWRQITGRHIYQPNPLGHRYSTPYSLALVTRGVQCRQNGSVGVFMCKGGTGHGRLNQTKSNQPLQYCTVPLPRRWACPGTGSGSTYCRSPMKTARCSGSPCRPGPRQSGRRGLQRQTSTALAGSGHGAQSEISTVCT